MGRTHPKFYRTKEGHEEKLSEMMGQTKNLLRIFGGWNGLARFFVDLNLDKAVLAKKGKRWPNHRIRRKMMRKTLQFHTLDQFSEHVVGF